MTGDDDRPRGPALAAFARRLFQNAFDRRHPLRSLRRWPVWLVAVARRRPVVARFETGGLRMRLQPRLHSFGTTSIYIRRDRYEPELLAMRRLVRPGSVAIDVGGSYGIFALFLAEFVGHAGRVHCLEPGRFSFAQLRANLSINPQGVRVVAHNLAAAERTGTLRLAHIGGSPVNFSIGAGAGQGTEEVAAARIDSLLTPAEQARVSFIKIDVEGYEQAALAGAHGVLVASHPAIMFEVSAAALARQGHTPADTYAHLAAYGYRFWTLGEDGQFQPVDGTPDGNIFAAMSDLAGAPN